MHIENKQKCCEHFERLCGGSRFVAMRKHLTWYCRNFRGAAEIRARMTRANNAEDVRRILAQFLLQFHSEAKQSAGMFPVSHPHLEPAIPAS